MYDGGLRAYSTRLAVKLLFLKRNQESRQIPCLSAGLQMVFRFELGYNLCIKLHVPITLQDAGSRSRVRPQPKPGLREASAGSFVRYIEEALTIEVILFKMNMHMHIP